MKPFAQPQQEGCTETCRVLVFHISSIPDLVDDELVGVSEPFAGLQSEFLLVLSETGPQPPQGIRRSDEHGVADLEKEKVITGGVGHNIKKKISPRSCENKEPASRYVITTVIINVRAINIRATAAAAAGALAI